MLPNAATLFGVAATLACLALLTMRPRAKRVAGPRWRNLISPACAIGSLALLNVLAVSGVHRLAACITDGIIGSVVLLAWFGPRLWPGRIRRRV